MGRPAAKAAAREQGDDLALAREPGMPVAQNAIAGLPALVVAHDGTLKFATSQSEPLRHNNELNPLIRQHVAAARDSGEAQAVRVAVDDEGEPRRFDLTLMPSLNGDVLIIARETSFEANLITALTQSRELFRDLAACNVDFAFETDAEGAFSWVSPRGALGFSAVELHGAHPTTVFGEVAGVEVFASADRVEDTEVWLHGKDGKAHCLVINAIAVGAADGARKATRGVARDVTQLRMHEKQAWRTKRREGLASEIIEAMRAEIDPARMLAVTAAALRKATKADAVSIVASKGGLSAQAGGTEAKLVLKLNANAIYHGSYNGIITLVREAGRDAFGDDERQLLAAVMPQLGVAIALGESLVERGMHSRSGE